MSDKSFKTAKNKILKTWNRTEKNRSDEAGLVKEVLIGLQNNFNKSIVIVPLIVREEIIHTFGDESVGLLRLASIEEFVISNMNDSLLPFVKIRRKFYRDDQDIGDIPSEVFEKFENYSLDNISWKFIDDNTVLLQIQIPFVNFNNKTFMDIDLIIRNPNIYTSLPKFKL